MTNGGRVYLIGTGPGDPGLLSARGIRLLAEADVVVYDRGAERVLRWAKLEAERIAAGAPAERDTAQEAISMLVAEKARDGHVVARLKWGDPFVFDSGAKEALFLHEHGIPFEVVPGIPVAIGVPAYAGVPLTYPGAGNAVLLVRGHESQSDALPDINWDAAARLEGTLVCYCSGRQAPAVLQALLDHGAAADQTAALIYQGTRPRQRTTTGTISELLEATQTSTDPDSAILIVGKVVALREHLRWFDSRPLFGRRIVVTPAREHGHDVAEWLDNLGADVIEAPAYHITPPEDPEAVERAAASVSGFSWVLFESAQAVHRFLAAVGRGPRDMRSFGGVLVGAVGTATADRLAAAGLRPDLELNEYRPETVADALMAKGPLAGQRVLIVRSDHGREFVAHELANRGALVTDLVAYRLVAESSDSAVAQDLYRMLMEEGADAVAFTSPTSVQLFVQMLGREPAVDLLGTTLVAAIGPVTKAAAAELGISVGLVPEVYTADGLVRALVAHFGT